MIFSSRSSGRFRLAQMLLLLLPLAACAKVDHMATGSAVPDDYRQRHPIVLANKPQT